MKFYIFHFTHTMSIYSCKFESCNLIETTNDICYVDFN